jgi:hypothetical protein
MGDHRPRAGHSPHAVVSPLSRSLSRGSHAGSAVSRREEGRHGESSQHGQHYVGYNADAAAYHTRSDSRENHSPRFAPEADRSSQSSRYLAPPPQSSMLRADDRQFAFSDRYSNITGALSGTSGRHPSVPPPQRPMSSHATSQLSRSQPPPSPPASRGAHPVHTASPVRPTRARYSPAEYRSPRPLSPPASRGEIFPLPPRPNFHSASTASHDIDRSRSRTSVHSDYSPNHTRRPSTTPSDQADDASSLGDEGNASSELASAHGGPTLQRPKRTRVLMTHVQQQRLGTLWKRVSFMHLTCSRSVDRK